MKALDRRALQAKIDRVARHGQAFYEAQRELNDWCLSRYGTEPGDIDADSIIDAVFGGCGKPSGMEAEEFDQIMREGTANG